MGLEPTTFGTTNRRSNQLSYNLRVVLYNNKGNVKKVPFAIKKIKKGGGSGIRTPGTLSGTAVFKTAAIDRSAKPP